jgi:uncharacterized protein (DUF305 family)
MRTQLALVALAVGSVVAVAVHAQGNAPSAFSLPKACEAAAQASGQGPMDKMKASMDEMMKAVMADMGQMTPSQKGLHEAMMKMHSPMMQGMMAKDADVAWICAMIPHHQGAIEMARAGLLGADNAESKRLAEETISSNEKELEKLIAWVEKHAERESRNETTGTRAK